MSKKFKKSLKQTMGIVGIMIALLVIVSLGLSQFDVKESLDFGKKQIPEQVLKYEELIRGYSEKYDVSEHVPLIMAIMTQESGGRGDDPMQASESYCGERNCIQDPQTSIKQGVKYFSKTLEAADGDVDLAIQSYNFGRGFIRYIQEKNAAYSVEEAIAFSQKKYKEVAHPEKYRCVRDDSKKLKACYGDIYYVEAVRDYERQFIKSE